MTKKSEKLEAIKKKLDDIDKKLNKILAVRSMATRIMSPNQRAFVPKPLSSLPKHLKKTASAIATMGQGTAKQVAAKTGRTRAAESDYLNQLAREGFLKKERRGKKVHFLVFSLHTICPSCGTRVLMTSTYCNRCGAPLSKS